jgi:prepilin-type N-terminal cleavage/methylation domain-containing protein
MQTNNPSKHRSERGFTFIEVIVALTLLAASASILIGMEGAAIRRTIRDQNAQQATLAARRIMASIEAIDAKDFNLGSSDNRPVEELLSELGVDSSQQQRNSALTASLLVEDQPIPFPNTTINPMKRLTLTISWGQGRDDFITVFYLRNGV